MSVAWSSSPGASADAPARSRPAGADGAGAYVVARIAAFAIDMLAVALTTLMAALSLAMIGAAGGLPVLASQPVDVGVFALAFAAYFAAGERRPAPGTLGKAAFRLAVQRADGQPLGWPLAVARQGFKLLAGLALPLAWAIPGGRAPHDLLAGSRVVRRATPPTTLATAPGGT